MEEGSPMKRLFAAACAIGASVVMSSAAMADTVTRTPSPVPTLTFTGICSFPFLAQPVINGEYTISFVNQNAALVKQIVAGALIVNFTNLTTQKTITENVSGPGIFTFNADGSITFDAMGTAFGFTVIGAGRVVIQIAPNGTATIVSQVGHFQDFCSLLS
jgi:hypothetical protein